MDVAWNAAPSGVVIHYQLTGYDSGQLYYFTGLRRGYPGYNVILDGVAVEIFWYSLGQRDQYQTGYKLVGPPNNHDIPIVELYILPEGMKAIKDNHIK